MDETTIRQKLAADVIGTAFLVFVDLGDPAARAAELELSTR